LSYYRGGKRAAQLKAVRRHIFDVFEDLTKEREVDVFHPDEVFLQQVIIILLNEINLYSTTDAVYQRRIDELDE
jgi:hypothetical protein